MLLYTGVMQLVMSTHEKRMLMVQHISTPPDDIPATIAGAVAAGGRIQWRHALAGLFELAQKQIVKFYEKQDESQLLKKHIYVKKKKKKSAQVTPYEKLLCRISFVDDNFKSQRHVQVNDIGRKLRASSAMGAYRSAVKQELAALGWLEASREQGRRRLQVGGLALGAVGLVGMILSELLRQDLGAGPLLLAFAVLLSGALLVALGFTISPLSDSGRLAQAQWRAFFQHLRRIARSDSADRL